MPKKLNPVQIRVRSICRREFERDVYRPGVISSTRLVWGSLGGSLALVFISLLSEMTGIALVFPPLAATCFINSNCIYLRVARPKPVIVGHFVSAVGGLAGVWTGELLAGGSDLVLPLKLSLALLYAALLMQFFDADHPPAAATAVIPAVLPLPMPAWLFPLYMAWGATLAVLFALVWNRVWLEFPAKDDDHCLKYAGLYMTKAQVWGMALCLASMALMSCKPILPALYSLGLGGMTLGVLLLGTHHFAGNLAAQLPIYRRPAKQNSRDD